MNGCGGGSGRGWGGGVGELNKVNDDDVAQDRLR